MRIRIFLGAGLAALLATSAQAQPVPPGPPAENLPSSWVTLGTHGGPVPNADRSQPANLLLVGRDAYLVDAGDGAAEQMAKAGMPIQRLSGIFISHLHFDHTGGLAGVLGLRFQSGGQGVLTIYGPPGTKQMVDGIVASMVPGGMAGYGVPGEESRDPAPGIAVVEWSGGEDVQVGAMRVRNAENTHYSFAPDSPLLGHYKSLSFRFDTPDRDIVYTGDTAPSAAVDALGVGADLLVSELIDVEAQFRSMGMPPDIEAAGPVRVLVEHLRTHHITAHEIGEMARAMGVKEVVLTHFVIGNGGADALRRYVGEVRAVHDVPVIAARDLDIF